jgi:hypothetical protein
VKLLALAQHVRHEQTHFLLVLLHLRFVAFDSHLMLVDLIGLLVHVVLKIDFHLLHFVETAAKSNTKDVKLEP